MEGHIYIIDNKKLNDIKCDLHEIKKPYTKYCINCNKNICNWCKDHSNHKLIDFSLIEPNPEKYKINEQNLERMSLINTQFFKNASIYFEKKREQILKILEEINEIISDIEKTSSLFEAQLKFNLSIFNAFKDNQINYYVLKNFNNLKFILDVKSYKNKWDINKFKFLERENKLNLLNVSKFNFYYINSSKKAVITDGYTNMWISERYCRHWGLKEAIRELIQNQYDGVISKINQKNNLQVIKLGNKENINDIQVYLNFDFKNRIDNKIYGQIRYDKLNKILTISNLGLLWLGDFLLGGFKDEQNNSNLIGTFGEGMKLAILALCRLNKNITIISDNKKYSFLIREDEIFLKNNQPQRCLHFKHEVIKNNDKNNIIVIINNICIEEWGENIINFLWLLDDNADIYSSFDNTNKKVGQLLGENYLKGKIYVKGIFVQKIKPKNGVQEANCYGFNVNLQLERDRNCIPDENKLKISIS